VSVGRLPGEEHASNAEPLAAADDGAGSLALEGRLVDLPLAGDDELRSSGMLVESDPVATVLEAAWANVWLVDSDRLITPPLDGRILPGVTRARVVAQAGSLGLSVAERPITLRQARAGRAMLTSSLQLAAAAAFEDGPEPDQAVVATIGRIRRALLETDWE